MAASNLARAILGWLRQGYPEGIPVTDFVPLLEVLNRKLTESEVNAIVALLIESSESEITRSDIEAAVADRLLATPSDSDVVRVAAKLAGGGWPLSGLADIRREGSS